MPTPRAARASSGSRPGRAPTPSASPRSVRPRSSSRAATRARSPSSRSWCIALFIPVYWFYDLGVPALGVDGPHGEDRREQFVTDVAAWLRPVPRQLRPLPRRERRGRCRAAAQQPGQAVQRHQRRTAAPARGISTRTTSQQRAGGRWPLRVRRRQERHARVAGSPTVRSTTARWRSSSRSSPPAPRSRSTYDPHAGGHGAAADPDATPYTVTGWRDLELGAGAGRDAAARLLARPTATPAFADTAAPDASLAPIDNPGHRGCAPRRSRST